VSVETPTARLPARGVAPARSIRGTVRVPGDKSVSHRGVLLNGLGIGRARITNFSGGADCASTLACLRALGVFSQQDDNQVILHGRGLDGLREPQDVLDCGNSGTSMRLLTGVLAGAGLFAVLSGDASLRRRPMARIIEPLRSVGASVDGRDHGRLPPLVVRPHAGLHGGEHRLPVASAQVKSCLLLAGLFADGPTSIVEPATTRDHTERMLRAMGAQIDQQQARITLTPGPELRCVDVDVPGDFSSAAFWIALGVVHPHAEVRVINVGLNPTRTGLLRILEQMGATFDVQNQRDVAGEPVGDIVACSSRLRATTVDAELVALAIDEVPLVALLAAHADGETVVIGAQELRAKESDRLSVVADGLRALGADIDLTDDGWRVRPSRLEAGRVQSHGDHRMAMLFALAGAVGGGTEIEDAECVAISYPSFWTDLAALSTP
jgi:3-phosphoshikimate 1-carboxyvinyltransferase